VTSVAVLGPGGVGGFLAAALVGGGQADVTVVAREPTADALTHRGFVVTSRLLGEFTARPAIVTRLETETDVLLIATKAAGLADALVRIGATPRLVVPLLNGVEHLATLRAHFGAERVPAAVIRIESDRPAVGVIEQTSPAVRIDLASELPELAARLPPVAQLLSSAGIEVRLQIREADVMWSKLARLCTLALTTSASGATIGFVRSDPRWRSAMESSIAEVVAVARADGAEITAEQTLAELDAAPEGLSSSMSRDIAAGRPPELDAIAGAVIRGGARHDLRCPTVQWLAERVAVAAA
jgi:2-dehydropantoate 2-reductase